MRFLECVKKISDVKGFHLKKDSYVVSWSNKLVQFFDDSWFLFNLFIIILFFPILSIASQKQSQQLKGSAFISADFVEYEAAEQFIYAKGNIKVTFDHYVLTAANLLYDIEQDIMWAGGNVRIKDNKGKIILGETVILKDKLKTGLIQDFILKFSDNTLLASRLAERINKNQTILYKATFTPCQISCGNKPIWQISAKKTYVDFDKQKMVYNNLFFEIYGIPVFFSPYFSHPTPKAKAQSGILMPEIKDNKLGIPVYFRVKPNLDLTITPRIVHKNSLFDLEMRHKISSGSYILQASYADIAYKNKRIDSGYVSSQGNFSFDNYGYGFSLRRTSDKAFLKNYHDIHDSYLASRLYLNKVVRSDYLSIEGFSFQGLRAEDRSDLDPIIFPKIRTKNIFNLNDNENTYLTAATDVLSYKEQAGKEIFRPSMGLALTHNLQTRKGHLLYFNTSIRGDVYIINNNSRSVIKNKRSMSRNIPEIQLIWRYPLASNIGSNFVMDVEPTVSTTIGRKFKESFYKFGIVDASKYEVAVYNFLSSNRYSGIDYHEFGKRLNYGVNTTTIFRESYFNVFLGQSLSKDNTPATDNIENLGNFSVKFLDEFDFFYRFRKDKHFNPILTEIGSNAHYNKFNFRASFIQLNNQKRYYAAENFILSRDNSRQIYYSADYQLTPSWLIGNETWFDVSSKKMRILYKSIKVTYSKDCVSITGKFYDDYTYDNVRGIKKTHSKTVSVGLKILNM